MTRPESALYFHKQCFDGVVSAVIARTYLVEHDNWQEPVLMPVGYEQQPTWTSKALPRLTAVVDFLFHPEARFWADHHETTFVAGPPPQMHEGWLYDATADSCAGLLARKLTPVASALGRFANLASWAERTDAARYQSPEEALFPRSAALVVNSALTDATDQQCSALVKFLCRHALAEAAALPWVQTTATAMQKRVAAGLQLLRQELRTDGGVASFVVMAPADVLVHRYAPYLLSPNALYSAGLIQLPNKIRLSVMRNPWIEFESIHLGRLCARFGGGGHQRVGAASFALADHDEAERALHEVVRAMRQHTAGTMTNDRAV